MRSTLNKGFTLIEVLITILVVVVGMTGAAKLQTAASKAQVNNHQTSQALQILEDLADRMRLDTDRSNYTINQTAEQLCAGAAPRACSSYSTQNGVVDAVDNCNEAEVASFNIWNAFCATGNRGQFAFRSVGDKLQLESVSISCAPAAAGACDADAIYTLQAVVSSRAVNAGTAAFDSQTVSLLVYP